MKSHLFVISKNIGPLTKLVFLGKLKAELVKGKLLPKSKTSFVLHPTKCPLLWHKDHEKILLSLTVILARLILLNAL